MPADTDAATGHLPDEPLAERLERRVVVQWRLVAAAWALVPVGAPALALALAGTPVLALVWATVTLVAAVALVATAPDLWWRRWSFTVTDEAVELRHGLLVRVHSVVPHFRVQHVEVTRDVLEHRLGLASLTVATASAATDATIPGLRPARADAIRHHILGHTATEDAV